MAVKYACHFLHKHDGSDGPCQKAAVYLVHIWGDVEPQIHGPLKDDAERLAQAIKIREKEDGGLYRLNVFANGVPEMETFSGSELPEEHF